MLTIRHWALACILAVPLSSWALAQARRSSSLPTDEAAARYGLVRRWFTYVPVDGVKERVQRVRVVGDQVHLQTNASRVHVLDGETGKLLWSAQLGRAVPGQFGSAINSTAIFVINGSNLYKLDRTDGSQVWTLRLPQAANAAPAADDEHVVVSTADGRIYTYYVDSREVHWFYQTNAPVSMPAAFVDDKIVCASEDGFLYVFPSSERNPLMRYKTDAPVSAPLAIWGRYVLLPSRDFNVYAVDVRGRLGQETKWIYPSGGQIRNPVTVVDNEAYVAPEDGGLHAVNVETGERLWWHPRANQFVAASAKRVYASDKYGQLILLDRSNGRSLGTWDMHDFDFRVRNESNDRVYLATAKGLVVCLHEKDSPEPLVHAKPLPAAPAEQKPVKPAVENAP
jgi:outer membrane protein assembly factor BamB